MSDDPKILYVNCEDQLMSDQGRPMVHLDEYVALKRKIKRIELLIKDDERAEKVAKDGEDPNWMYSLSAINDYRTEILKEVGATIHRKI